MAAVSYQLLLDGVPVAPELLDAIQEIEVEDHAEMADMLRLRVAMGVREDGSGWNLLDDDLFPRLRRLNLVVTVGKISESLIEAYVIESNAELSNDPGESVLEVVAMDPTVLMNLEEKVRPWPNMADSEIATLIFEDHAFNPKVESTQPVRQVADTTTIQRGTDIQFLRQLAKNNGYEVFVEVDSATGDIEGHFHPPKLDPTPQGVLSINMGAATNVNSFKARYDMLRPTTAQITGLDIATQADQPAQEAGASLTELGTAPTIPSDRPRKVLLSQTGLAQTSELQTLAAATVDRSSWAISAEGELNTVAYEGILRAKRPVAVRGAGRQFSGNYYVQRVLHTMSGDGYTQAFTLRRNALALTGRESFVEDQALPA